jgi:hypothetical protein
VIVGDEALSRTKISHLPLRRYPTGRLSVDVDADPPVDQIGIQITAGERLKLYLLQPLRDVLHPGQRPNAVAKHDSPHRKRPYQKSKSVRDACSCTSDIAGSLERVTGQLGST